MCLEHDTVIPCMYASEDEYRCGASPLLINVRREGVPVIDEAWSEEILGR